MDAMTRGLIADGNTVKVLTIATEKHPWLPEELSEEYMAQTRIEALKVDTELNRVDALSNILTGDSYNISRFFSSEFDRLLTDVLRKEVFDLIIFESLFTAPYLKTVRHLSDGLAILRTHNVEHRIWEQMAQETDALTKRLYLKHLAERLRGYEVNALKDFDALASISEDDTRHFKSLGCDSPIFFVPFGLDEKELPPPCLVQRSSPFTWAPWIGLPMYKASSGSLTRFGLWFGANYRKLNCSWPDAISRKNMPFLLPEFACLAKSKMHGP